MDPLSQGLLGATLAAGAAKKPATRYAAVVGFVSALLADADVLIASSDDSLLNIEFHRHFSHSLIFIPVGGLIGALLLWWPLRQRLAFKSIYLYALLGYATSGLLDACTSYGTHLLWPFTDTRFAWSIIAIVDPLFTLILLVALVLALKSRRPLRAQVGLALAGAYLLLGLWQHHNALQAGFELAARRGHEVERIIVKPTLANLLLWRSVYESGGRFYVDAVRLGLFSADRVYPGSSAARFDLARGRPEIARDSLMYRDIERFHKLSDGFVVDDPARADVLIDIRYSMLPTHMTPMWGIETDGPSSRHARFRIYRERPDDFRTRFLAMLLGRNLPG